VGASFVTLATIGCDAKAAEDVYLSVKYLTVNTHRQSVFADGLAIRMGRMARTADGIQTGVRRRSSGILRRKRAASSLQRRSAFANLHSS
jgi:hypothetical protein